MTPDILLLVAIAALLSGITTGYALNHWLFARAQKAIDHDWRDIAYYHAQHAERLDLDDTRLGINCGIEYSIAEMQLTLDQLREHAQTYTEKADARPNSAA